MSSFKDKTQLRRTFAIISHPDAGKTTLTEKLLLFGGAIQLAGAVKARGDARRARSDWMKVERERGISVASSVMTYEYSGCTFNLLDTPGHEDFSEDTYRVLTAVDSAVMVIDAAKGIEARTRKLFEICRLRDVPIITFINKMDRDSQDAFALLSEIEDTLALEVCPVTWPIGSGRDFKGCYDLLNDRLILMEKGSKVQEAICEGLEDEKLNTYLTSNEILKLKEDVEMIRGICPPFSLESYRLGIQTPVFFGSAVNNFGVQELIDGILTYAPSPRSQPTESRDVEPLEENVSGFVFKIQANMDPKHRDRIAFVRLCSGHFKKGMKLTHVRSGKAIPMHNPIMFLAQDREVAEEAFAGDIIGVPNHGNLRIGDALTQGEGLRFTGIPSFAPELLQKIRAKDPLKAKHLGKALQQIAEEGGASVFKPTIGTEWFVGVVGALQFDVLADRIRTEYEVSVIFEPTTLYTARWIRAESPLVLEKFVNANKASLGTDHDGEWVFLARNAWHLNKAVEDYPEIKFLETRQNA